MSTTVSKPTGGSFVRGSPQIGVVSTNYNTPLVPPTLAPLRNPICPWDASTTWHRAFAPNSLTMRSNARQLQTLGLPAPPPPPTDDGIYLVPCVTGGKLRYLARSPSQLLQNSMERPATSAGFHQSSSSSMSSMAMSSSSFASAREHTPAYLGSVARLPVMRQPEDLHSPSPYADLHSPTRLLTPQHLKHNGEYRQQTFAPRRFGQPHVWRSIMQEQWESVHGPRAHY